MTTIEAPAPRTVADAGPTPGQGRWLGIGLLIAHVIVALVLTSTIFSAAYHFEGVGSRDDLWRFGIAPQVAFAGAWIPLVIDAGMLLLALGLVPRWAWLIPASGIAVSTVIAMCAIATFDPVPVVGG